MRKLLLEKKTIDLKQFLGEHELDSIEIPQTRKQRLEPPSSPNIASHEPPFL